MYVYTYILLVIQSFLKNIFIIILFNSYKQKNVKQLPKYDVQKSSQDKHLKKKSIIQTLLDEYNNQPIKKVIENNVPRNLLQNKVSKKMLQDTKTDKKTLYARYYKKYNINYYYIIEIKSIHLYKLYDIIYYIII